MRRANVECTMVGMDKLEVTSSHQIKIKMDQIYDGLDNYDAVVIPGGMPGASNLRDDSRVIDLVKQFNHDGKIIGAICAGPIVLQEADVIKGKTVTCYPGFEATAQKPLPPIRHICGLGASVGCERVERTFNAPRTVN